MLLYLWRLFDESSILTLKKHCNSYYLGSLFICIMAIALTLSGWYTLVRYAEIEDSQHFSQIAKDAEVKIETRLLSYQDLLQGMVGYINASEYVSREEWLEYTKALNLKERYPGIIGIGYIANIPRRHLDAYVKNARMRISSDFHIKKIGTTKTDTHSSAFVIQYISPEFLSHAAVGLDISSEYRRRQAAEISRDTGRAQVTNILHLVQDNENTPGFLLLLPVYQKKSILTSKEHRIKAHQGWVYAPFKGNKIFKKIITNTSPEISFKVYDGKITSKNLIYQSFNKIQHVSPNLKMVHHFSFAGCTWLIEWETTQAFKSSPLHSQANWILSLGLLASLLLAGLLVVLNINRSRACQIAKLASKKLLEKHGELEIHADYWKILAEISAVAEQNMPSDDFIDFCLENICKHMGWPIAHLYQLNESEDVLYPSERWYINDSNKYKPFYTITMNKMFSKGEGLPGRVLESGKPLWIFDVTQDSNFPRVQSPIDIGVRAAFAFPIIIQGKTTAVVECFTDETLAPIENALVMLEQIGVHISRILERKQSTALLLHQNHILEYALEGIALLDAQGHYISVNQAYAQTAGYQIDEMLGMSWEKTVTPEALNTMRNAYQTMLKDGKVLIETTGLKKDGTLFFKRVLMVTNYNEIGVAVGSYCFMTDITKIKETEKAIQDSAVRFYAIFHQSFQFIGLMSPDGILLEANQSALDACGIKAQDVLDRPFWESPWWSHSLALQEKLKQAIVDANRGMLVRFEAQHPTSAGGLMTVDFSLKPVYNDVGEVVLLIPEGRDISERKIIEESLRASEERFRLVTEKVKDYAILMLDPNGYIVTWNIGAEGIKGYTANEVIGQHFSIFYLDEDKQRNYPSFELEQSSMHGQYEDEGWRVRKNGELFWANVIITALYDNSNVLIGYSKITRDLTERKQTEEKLKEAKLLAEQSTKYKSEFLANMSHEIRTPMNGVLGLTEILMTTELNEEQQHYLKNLQSSGQTLLTIINDLLDFSKIEAGKILLEPCPFMLRQMLNDTLYPFIKQSEQKGLSVQCHIDSEIPDLLSGDMNRIRQIVNNLLSNAIKFTHEGSISIGVEALSQRENKVKLHFWVTDTGIGLTQDEQQRIFEPFIQADASTSRRYGGTGLGLSIIKNLVNLMKGEIWIESEAGKGSTFHFTLELEHLLSEVPAGHDNDSNKNSYKSDLGLEILLAEDQEVNQLVASLMLKKIGCHATIAQNGKQVLELLKERHFDIIMMDMLMPEMDGLEATRFIRQGEAISGLHIPIIALTANAGERDREICLEAGMDDFITKPFKAEKLSDVIHSVLNK